MNAETVLHLIAFGHKMPSNEFEILRFLYLTGDFSGGYTELATSIYGKDKKCQTSNVRRAVLSLEQLGIVEVFRPEGMSKMNGCSLTENWYII